MTGAFLLTLGLLAASATLGTEHAHAQTTGFVCSVRLFTAAESPSFGYGSAGALAIGISRHPNCVGLITYATAVSSGASSYIATYYYTSAELQSLYLAAIQARVAQLRVSITIAPLTQQYEYGGFGI
jgi:hypothetical protein